MILRDLPNPEALVQEASMSAARAAARSVGSRDETQTTLGSPGLEDLATVAGRVAGAEAVGTSALQAARLECTFHVGLG